MAVKILDAGDRLMIDGGSQAEVEAALRDHVDRGARTITATVAVGRRWVAACTIPLKAYDPDRTDTFSLAEIHDAIKQQAETPEVDDGCTVQQMGFKRLIRGPTERDVKMRIEHLKRFGASLVTDVERDGDAWVAIVDTGGADKTYRW